MQRRTAIAAASAISITLVSGVIALGANLGALGFAGRHPNPPAAPVAAVQPLDRVSQAVPTPSRAGNHDDEHGEDEEHESTEHEGAEDLAPVRHFPNGETDD